MYLLIDRKIGRPRYIVRIAKCLASELRFRREHNLYQMLQKSNGALKTLTPVYYVTRNNTETASIRESYSAAQKYTGNSFSMERFYEGISGPAFARHSVLDTYSLDWLNWFQKGSAATDPGTFDNNVLSGQLEVLKDAILKSAGQPMATGVRADFLRCRIPQDILTSLFADLECRLKDIQPFRLPFTAVHGDFCQMNLLAYNESKAHERITCSERLANESGYFRNNQLGERTGIHVFDWEYLEIGIPLFDPWVYVIVCMYLSIHGRVNKHTIGQFLTGTWNYSGRVEHCLAYYARISGIPGDLLVGYLPMALLTLYVREASRAAGYYGPVELLEETVISLATNRRQVWRYLDALIERLQKETHH
jgi:hypothetical protein